MTGFIPGSTQDGTSQSSISDIAPQMPGHPDGWPGRARVGAVSDTDIGEVGGREEPHDPEWLPHDHQIDEQTCMKYT